MMSNKVHDGNQARQHPTIPMSGSRCRMGESKLEIKQLESTSGATRQTVDNPGRIWSHTGSAARSADSAVEMQALGAKKVAPRRVKRKQRGKASKLEATAGTKPAREEAKVVLSDNAESGHKAKGASESPPWWGDGPPRLKYRGGVALGWDLPNGVKPPTNPQDVIIGWYQRPKKACQYVFLESSVLWPAAATRMALRAENHSPWYKWLGEFESLCDPTVLLTYLGRINKPCKRVRQVMGRLPARIVDEREARNLIRVRQGEPPIDSEPEEESSSDSDADREVEPAHAAIMDMGLDPLYRAPEDPPPPEDPLLLPHNLIAPPPGPPGDNDSDSESDGDIPGPPAGPPPPPPPEAGVGDVADEEVQDEVPPVLEDVEEEEYEPPEYPGKRYAADARLHKEHCERLKENTPQYRALEMLEAYYPGYHIISPHILGVNTRSDENGVLAGVDPTHHRGPIPKGPTEVPPAENYLFFDCIPSERALAQLPVVSDYLIVTAHLEYVNERRFNQMQYTAASPLHDDSAGLYTVCDVHNTIMVRCISPTLGGCTYTRLNYGYSELGSIPTQTRSWTESSTSPGHWEYLRRDRGLRQWLARRSRLQVAAAILTFGLWRPKRSHRDPLSDWIFVPAELTRVMQAEHRAQHTPSDDAVRAQNWMRNHPLQFVTHTSDLLIAYAMTVPHIDYSGRTRVFEDKLGDAKYERTAAQAFAQIEDDTCCCCC